MPSSETKKRKYEVEEKGVTCCFVEADSVSVSPSGALCFHKRDSEITGYFAMPIEAFAPGTWLHVKEISNE